MADHKFNLEADLKFNLDKASKANLDALKKSEVNLKIDSKGIEKAIKAAQASAVSAVISPITDIIKHLNSQVAKEFSGLQASAKAGADGVAKIAASAEKAASGVKPKGGAGRASGSGGSAEISALMQSIVGGLKNIKDAIPKVSDIPPTGGGGKPSTAAKGAQDTFRDLDASFTKLVNNISKTSKGLEDLNKVLSGIDVNAGRQPQVQQQTAVQTSVRPTMALSEVQYAGTRAAASNISQHVKGGGTPTVGPGAIRDVAAAAESAIVSASSLTKNLPKENFEKLAKSLEGLSTGVGPALSKMSEMADQAAAGGKVSIRKLYEQFKEAKLTLIEGNRGSKVQIERAFSNASAEMFGSFRVAIGRGLLETAKATQQALDKAMSSGAPVAEIATLEAQLNKDLAKMVQHITKGVFTRTGKRRTRSEYRSAEVGGFLPQVGAVVDTSSSNARSDAEDKLRTRIEKIIKASDEEFLSIRAKLNADGAGIAAQDKVNAALELVAKELTGSAKDVQFLSRMMHDVSTIFATYEDEITQKKISSGITGMQSKAIKGKIPTDIPYDQQLRLLGRNKQTSVSSRWGRKAQEVAVESIGRTNFDAAGNVKQYADATSAAKELYEQTKKQVRTVEGLRSSLEAVVALMKETKAQGADEIIRTGQIKSLQSTMKEMDKFGANVRPVALYGLEAFSGMSKRAVEIGTEFNELKTPIMRAEQIFGFMGNTSEEIRNNLLTAISALKRADAGELGSPQTKETISELNRTHKQLEKGKIPQNIGRDSQIKVAQSLVQDADRRLQKAAPGATESFSFDIKDKSGRGLKKIQVELKRTKNEFDRVKISAKETNSAMAGGGGALGSLQTAFRRVALWGAAAGLTYGAVRALRSAVDVMTKVETGVIRVGKVMNAATANFDGFKEKVLDVASAITNEFGVAIENVLETMFTFGQQGLKFAEVAQLASTTALAENVTNLSGPQAADALTAAFRQFNLEASDSNRILDAWNEVANRTAIEENVIAEATKKAGIAARNAGVSFDEFNGIVSGLGAATRQSGNVVGTSLKFIFQRIGRPIAVSALKDVGVDVKNAAGNFRGFTQVTSDLNEKWKNLTQTQKLNIAQAVAGIRQYNAFLVVMDQFDAIQQATDISVRSSGSAMRENQMVMQSAAKQFARLQEEVKETAISMGQFFLPAGKVVISVLDGLFSALNVLPGPVKAVAGVLGVVGIASLKFADHVDMLLTGLTSIPQGAGSMGKALKDAFASIGRGRGLETLSETALFATSSFRKASMQVGDFSKGGLADIANTFMGVSAGASLMGNKIDLNSSKLSKFGAAVRGVKVGETVLGVRDMNSIFSKLGLTVAKVGQAFAAPIGMLGQYLAGVEKVTFASGAASIASKGFLVSLAGFAGGLAVIGGLLYGAAAAWGRFSETGDQAVERLKPQVAAMEEQLNEARKYQTVLDGLTKARKSLAKSVELEKSPGSVQKKKAEGRYEPSTLASIEVSKKQKSLLTDMGVGALDAVAGLDKLGNVVIKTDKDLSGMSHSLVETQANAVALVKAEQALAVAQEINGGKWYQLAKASDTYSSALSKQDKWLKVAAGYKDLFPELPGVKLSSGNFAKEFGKINNDVIKAQAAVDKYGFTLESVLSSLPKETPTSFFQGILADDDQVKILEAFAKTIENRLGGKSVTAVQALNHWFLRVKTGIEQLGYTAEHTFAKFEKLGVEPINITKANVNDIISEMESSTAQFENSIVKFTLPTDDVAKQARVMFEESGRAVVEYFDSSNQHVKESLDDLVDKSKDVALAVKTNIAQVLRESALNLSKIATGAGAGTVFKGDIKLGAKLDIDLTPQQQVAKTLPKLYRDAVLAQERYEDSLRQAKDAIGKNTEAESERVKALDQVAAQYNAVATLVRVATELATISQEAERASTALRDLTIEQGVDTFLASFKSGAEKGLIDNIKSTPIKLSSDLTADELAVKSSPGIFQQQAKDKKTTDGLRNVAISTAKFASDLPEILKEFAAGQSKFGSSVSLADVIAKVNKGESLSGIKSAALEETKVKHLSSIEKNTKTIADAAGVTSPGVKSKTAAGVRDDAVIKELRNLEFIKNKSEKALDTYDRASKKVATTREQPTTDRTTIRQLVLDEAKKGGTATDDRALRLQKEAETVYAKQLKEAEVQRVKASVAFAIDKRGPAGTAGAEAKARLSGSQQLVEQITTALEKVRSPDAVGVFKKALEEGLKPDYQAKLKNDTTAVTAEDKAKADNVAAIAARTQASALGVLTKGLLAASAAQDAFNAGLGSLLSDFTGFTKALRDGVNNIRNALSSRKITQAFTAPLAGALKSVSVFTPQKIGKTTSELSPIERLNVDFPSMFKKMGEYQEVFAPQTEALHKELTSRIIKSETRINDFRSAGQDKLAAAATETLNKEISLRSRLETIMKSTREAMSPLAESLQKMVAAATAAKAIDDIVAALEKASAIQYDTTSLDMALGKHPLSATPTPYGQPRDLNKFERELYQIKQQMAQPQSYEQRQQLERKKKEVEFNRDEAVIGYKQQKEDEKLVNQKSKAEQALSVLYDAQQKGVAGAEPIMQQLKARLESAGDIVDRPGSFGQEGTKFYKGVRMDDLQSEMRDITASLAQSNRAEMMGPLESLTSVGNESLRSIDASLKSMTDTSAEGGTDLVKQLQETLLKVFYGADKVKSDKEGVGIVTVAKVLEGAFSSVSTAADSAASALSKLAGGNSSLIGGIVSGVAAAIKNAPATKKNAYGGLIEGVGNGDTVSSLLTPGEFVIPKTATSRLGSLHGKGIFSMLRAGVLPGFASGGSVSKKDSDAAIMLLLGNPDVQSVAVTGNSAVVSSKGDLGSDFRKRFLNSTGLDVLTRRPAKATDYSAPATDGPNRDAAVMSLLSSNPDLLSVNMVNGVATVQTRGQLNTELRKKILARTGARMVVSESAGTSGYSLTAGVSSVLSDKGYLYSGVSGDSLSVGTTRQISAEEIKKLRELTGAKKVVARHTDNDPYLGANFDTAPYLQQKRNRGPLFAAGGAVSGPGGPTSDMVPILASNGEYIMNARSAQSIGLAKLEYMNRSGNVPRYAAGGLVGSNTSSSSTSVEIDAGGVASEIRQAIEEAIFSGAEKIKESFSDGPVLQIPDNIKEMLTVSVGDSVGGPGAARIEAAEGSIDVLREEFMSLSKNVDSVSEYAMSISVDDIKQYVNTSLYEQKSLMDTDLNDRFSTVAQDLSATVDQTVISKVSEVSSQLSDIKSLASQGLTAAQQALSRSMVL